jgi:hypothetical protein
MYHLATLTEAETASNHWKKVNLENGCLPLSNETIDILEVDGAGIQCYVRLTKT